MKNVLNSKYTQYLMNKLNKFSSILTSNKKNGAAQSMLYALGLKSSDMVKPQIGIGTVWLEGNPCNSKLNVISSAVSDNLKKTNILPMRFNTIGVSDGMSMGTEGMRYSLPSRELITDSFETVVRAQHYDGLICVPGCDKNLPASAMALARLNRPGFIIYGGSMKPSYKVINGKTEKLDIVSSFESYGRYIKGEIKDNERNDIVMNSCDQECGSCSGFYTANTMACLLEVMGLMLPNGSSNMSMSTNKQIEVFESGQVMHNLLEKDIKPLDIMTKEAFINAIKFLTIIGGSTNGIIHLLAMAKTANVKLSLDEFTDQEKLPVLTNMKPHGIHVMDDLDKIGGTSVLIKYLIENKILNGDCLTITGKTLWENVKKYKSIDFDKNIIHPISEPFKKNSHIRILKGNMAPDGCVSKIYSETKKFSGKAIVFNTEDEMLDALKDGKITSDHFVILRYQGESIGCPEMLQPTSALVGYFNERGQGDKIPPFATDGRFSGGSTGILVAHLPDAYKFKSVTALIEDDDIIELDLEKNTINIDLCNNELYARDIMAGILKPDLILSGYLRKYSKLVSDLDSGYLC